MNDHNHVDMPNRDTLSEEPVILPHEPRNFNIVCIDLKRRTLYPFGTPSSSEPFFWSRTRGEDFNKSYLYLRDLYEMHDGILDRPSTQAEWWFDTGDDLMKLIRSGNLNESRPTIPAPPIIGDSESLVCYDLVEKKLWYMCSPTVTILSWNDTYNPDDQERIRLYLAELHEHWDKNTDIPTPLEMIPSDYDSLEYLDLDTV